MKKRILFILAILCLQVCAWALFNGTNTLLFFENNLFDETGNNPATNGNLAVSFPQTPVAPQGTHWAGDFDGTHYLNDTLTAAVMAGASYWLVEFYMNVTTMSGSNIAVSSPTQWFDINANLITWVQSGQPNLNTSGVTINTSTTYLVDITFDGTTRKIYVDGTQRASGATSGTWDAAGANLKIGELFVPNIGAAFKGKLDKVRFCRFASAGDVPTSGFPLDDSTPTPTVTPTFTATPTYTFTASPTFTFTLTATPTFTATPTDTATFTATPTKTNSATSTNTPVASFTNSPTFTVTPTRVCGNDGNTSASGTYYAGNGTIFYKKITLSAGATVQNIYSYVFSGTGQIKGALYSDLNGYPRNLLFQSTPASASVGWRSVSITTGDLAAGSYWMAMECNGSVKMLYSRVGLDKFQYQQYGVWPNPAISQNVLGNAALYGFKCD